MAELLISDLESSVGFKKLTVVRVIVAEPQAEIGEFLLQVEQSLGTLIQGIFLLDESVLI